VSLLDFFEEPDLTFLETILDQDFRPDRSDLLATARILVKAVADDMDSRVTECGCGSPPYALNSEEYDASVELLKIAVQLTRLQRSVGNKEMARAPEEEEG
jgi:hypothetical protein